MTAQKQKVKRYSCQVYKNTKITKNTLRKNHPNKISPRAAASDVIEPSDQLSGSAQ